MIRGGSRLLRLACQDQPRAGPSRTLLVVEWPTLEPADSLVRRWRALRQSGLRSLGKGSELRGYHRLLYVRVGVEARPQRVQNRTWRW